MHLHHAADAFLLALDRVEHGVAGAEHAGVDPGEGQGADEGVGGDLERQRRERFVVVGMAFQVFIFVIRVGAFDRRDFRGGRQVVDHRIEHQRHALVLERRAADGRDNFIGQGAFTQAGLDLFVTQFLAIEVQLHEFVIGLGGCFDHVCAPFIGKLEHVGRNFFFAVAGALVVFVPVDGLHFHQVDLAFEVFLGANGQLNRYRMMTQAFVDLLDHAQEVGALAVHLVDVGQAWHVVLVGLAPDCLGLRLDAVRAAEYHDRAIEHAQ
ncbi:hypothetical protein D9M71_491890 [compost metagenome]